MSGSVEDISNEALTAKTSAENTSLQPIRRPPPFFTSSFARILGLQTLQITLSDCSGLTLHRAVGSCCIASKLSQEESSKPESWGKSLGFRGLGV